MDAATYREIEGSPRHREGQGCSSTLARVSRCLPGVPRNALALQGFHLEAALRDNFESETNTCLLSCSYQDLEKSTRNLDGLRRNNDYVWEQFKVKATSTCDPLHACCWNFQLQHSDGLRCRRSSARTLRWACSESAQRSTWHDPGPDQAAGSNQVRIGL